MAKPAAEMGRCPAPSGGKPRAPHQGLASPSPPAPPPACASLAAPPELLRGPRMASAAAAMREFGGEGRNPKRSPVHLWGGMKAWGASIAPA
eukprot:CAMPEP_0183571768 /NCGR_PEP_ID=MMETSP0371-20130417/126892_1 /TAXON_ID=268820 /ORGANISM="Peridinium aciculiferum, Strain PAER-2" /LENGTH=91 /DNA_ID=CAMNT_0025781557 /DNA_START=37 /DNA_END=308 /DNA_ORIENTATION=-